MASDRVPLTGTRIRDRRLDLGMRQADLAAKVGISPSYLNLIEHNRRRIAGTLLSDLSAELGVTRSQLTDGADRAVLDQMLAAAASFDVPAETDRIEEMASRYPGWAALIAALDTRNSHLQARVQELTDRMAHDPGLATSLHEVISAVTAIRSTASILTGSEDLDSDWQRRFHRNIHDDAVRLAASSDALVTYLDAPQDEAGSALSPLAEMELWLQDRDFHIEALEVPNAEIDALSAGSGLSPAARDLLHAYLRQYRDDAEAMPLETFSTAARDNDYDAGALARTLSAGLPAVLRRLASLPPDAGHPPMGLVQCDAAGAIMLLKGAPGLAFARGGAACPLWPVFTALGQPGRPIRRDVMTADRESGRLRCFAVASQSAADTFDAPPTVRSIMLVIPDPPEGDTPPLPVGISCRICPHTGCAARREPTALRGL